MVTPTSPNVAGSNVEMEPLDAAVNQESSAPATSEDTSRKSADTVAVVMKQSTLKALKQWWPAVLFSVATSANIIGEGYALVLVPGMFPQQQFKKYFGEALPSGEYDVPADWKSGLQAGPTVGEAIGLLAAGKMYDHYGFKKSMAFSLIALIAVTPITVFAINRPMLISGQILAGLPWGAFQLIAPMYASEICPQLVRPIMCNFVNLCWLFGQITASGVLRGVYKRTDEWAFRLPLAIQWGPYLVGLAAIFAIPESPYWLVRKGRIEDARKVIVRAGASGEEAQNMVQEIEDTNEAQKRSSGVEGIAEPTYWECFQGTDLRRTLIACVSWTSQPMVGSPLMASSTYFLIKCGLFESTAYTITICLYVAGIVGTVASWYSVEKLGRKTIFILGAASLASTMLGIGCTAFSDSSAAYWVAAGLLILANFLYNVTIGPTCYTVVSEIPSTRLKAKTIAIARIAYNAVSVGTQFLTNYELTPKATGGWDWGAYTGFFYSATAFLVLLWAYFLLPEVKGRSFAEIDVMFECKLSANKFASAVVDVENKTARVNGQEFTPPTLERVHTGSVTERESNPPLWKKLLRRRSSDATSTRGMASEDEGRGVVAS